MIPKIIHYIWLGGDRIPSEINDCIESWKSFMPDYQIMYWDGSIAEKMNIPFVNEAILYGKWAFASDVIRLWVMYQYGGIYLDTDVKVLKSFDPLLDNYAFIGREGCLQIHGQSTTYHLTSFCFGAEKNNSYIKRCLDYYNDRHFITSPDSSLPMELRMDVRNASYVHSEIAKLFGYNPSALAPLTQYCRDKVLTIYPPTAFSYPITHESYCYHISVGSWREDGGKDENYTISYKIRWRLRRIVEKILLRFNYVMVKLK